MNSACQYCGAESSAQEQMYQVGEAIVCATCAGVAPAHDELAAAAARARRAPRPKRRGSRVGIGVFAFVTLMLGISGGVGYMVYTGKLADTVAEHRDSITGASTVNSVIDRYNALVAEANALATDRKYAAAAQKFRDARAVASAVSDVQKQVDTSQLESIIAHYDALAAGRVPSETIVRTVNVDAGPAPVETPAVAEQHAPDIGFMKKGVVEPEAVASDVAPADRETPEPATPRRDAPSKRTDAYTVPK